MSNPVIKVVSYVSEYTLAPLLYGMEEEEIPFEIIDLDSGYDLCQAAYQASIQSSLSVGLAIDSSHAILHYKNLPKNEPLFEVDIQDVLEVMKLGTNAARLVKGIPFKPLREV
jgi:hypothetical protein